MAKGKIGDSAFLGEYKAKWKKDTTLDQNTNFY